MYRSWISQHGFNYTLHHSQTMGQYLSSSDQMSLTSTNSRSSISSSFTLFPFLPTEIRLQIWSEAVQIWRAPTVHHLGACSSKPKSGHVPSLLHACAESRTIALKAYECISSGHADRNVWIHPDNTIYFDTNANCDIDVMLLGMELSHPRMESIHPFWGVRNVRHFAISFRYWLLNPNMWQMDDHQWLEGFPNLETFSLVYNELYGGYGGEGELRDLQEGEDKILGAKLMKDSFIDVQQIMKDFITLFRKRELVTGLEMPRVKFMKMETPQLPQLNVIDMRRR